MDALLKAVFQKDALRPGKPLHLGLHNELVFEIGAKLAPNDEGLLAGECDGAERNRDHVLVDELGSLVLVEVDLPLSQLD